MRNTPKKRIAENNEGSAIVTVVISMVFIMALGMALLFAAYTGYSVEITQRGDKENFYDASSAMDDIRLGVQTLLSDSIATAYTQVLTKYVGKHDSDYDPQTEFNNRIIEQLAAKTVKVGDTQTKVFKDGTDSYGNAIITGYNKDALETFINARHQGNSELTGAGSAGKPSYSGKILKSVSLAALSVNYKNNGYESNITTDINITMPYFFASSSVTSSINNYAIIANNSLKQISGGNVTITGSVFAGCAESNGAGVSVSNNNNLLTITKGDLICKGTISADESGALNYTSPNNQLWTNQIDVGKSGKVTLDGSVFVANDLRLKSASATLSGTYFGFGDSTSDSEKSSSILVNGKGSSLNISGLSKLSLAGISFINTSDQSLYDTNNNPFSTAIPMGESMSVKSDQLAYLVPIKCISNFASNPCAFQNNASISPDVDTNTVLWGTGDDAKTLGDYINGKGSIQTIHKTIGDNLTVVYVFMAFSSKEYANEYFRDYFAADPKKIEQYMNLYLNLSDKADNAKINTAGNTFYMDDNSTEKTDDDKLTLTPASDSVYAAGAQLLYNRMQSTYLVFVNTLAVSKLPSNTTLEFKKGENVVAVVSNKDYRYDLSSPTTLQLIIASGDVLISNNSTHDGVRGFLGIVISGSDITVSADVNGAPLNSDMLNLTCKDVTDKEYKLSDFINNSAQIEGGSNASEDLWNLDSLVYYENWLKH